MGVSEMKIGFIGAGNMASAIIKGMVTAKTTAPRNIYVTDLEEDKVQSLQKIGIQAAKGNSAVVEQSDIVVIGVKPHIYPAVLQEISAVSGIENKVLVSIAPGLSIQYIKSFFNAEVKIVRTMPNTPALIGEGMTVTSYAHPVTAGEFEAVNEMFKSVGEVQAISEQYMNEVVAVNGSSPAYVYMMIEAMADAAVMRGIARDVAYKMASQAVAGAAKMVLETGMHPGQLKDMVCSPGGTTIQAVYRLEKNGFRSSLMEAMEQCTERAIELGKKLSE